MLHSLTRFVSVWSGHMLCDRMQVMTVRAASLKHDWPRCSHQAIMDEAQFTMLQNEDDCVRKEGLHVWLPRNEQAAPLRRADLVCPIPGQQAKTSPAPAKRCAFFIPLQRGGCIGLGKMPLSPIASCNLHLHFSYPKQHSG